AIVREAADDDYRFSSLVLAIARSVPFRLKRAAAQAPDAPAAAEPHPVTGCRGRAPRITPGNPAPPAISRPAIALQILQPAERSRCRSHAWRSRGRARVSGNRSRARTRGAGALRSPFPPTAPATHRARTAR